jgi:hypothetical protein
VNVTPDRENVGFLNAISGIENDFMELAGQDGGFVEHSGLQGRRN